MSLLKSVGKSSPQDTVFFSPQSIYRVLILTYFGAGGKTKEALERGLFLDWATHRSEVAEAFDVEWKERAQRVFEKEIQLASFERLFIAKDVELK